MTGWANMGVSCFLFHVSEMGVEEFWNWDLGILMSSKSC